MLPRSIITLALCIIALDKFNIVSSMRDANGEKMDIAQKKLLKEYYRDKSTKKTLRGGSSLFSHLKTISDVDVFDFFPLRANDPMANVLLCPNGGNRICLKTDRCIQAGRESCIGGSTCPEECPELLQCDKDRCAVLGSKENQNHQCAFQAGWFFFDDSYICPYNGQRNSETTLLTCGSYSTDLCGCLEKDNSCKTVGSAPFLAKICPENCPKLFTL